MIPWKRKEVIGDCTLYLGDSASVLPFLGRFDAVVTDPPYGISLGKGMGGGGKRMAGQPRNYSNGEWDKQRPKAEIFDIMIDVATVHIIWGGNYFTDYLPVSGKWLFWDKCQTMPTYSDGELAWTTIPGDAVKQFTYNGSGMQAKEKDRVHPTQKPVELMKWCLSSAGTPKTVVDPFMGSGTTGVACAKMGLRFSGIELDESYFDIACDRIRKAYEQPDLFVEASIKAEQVGMDF